MSKLRVAIVGAGHLGRIHAKLAKSNEQVEVVAVADPSEAARALVTEQLGLSTVADYRNLLTEIDAAIVAAPTVHHYEVASTLLRAGVHTLVEKPLATSPDQCNRLVNIARNHARILQTGHVERFNPAWTAVQSHLAQPKYIEATRIGPYSGRSTDIGAVMDLMIHDIDLVLSLDRSEVVDVSASGLAVVGNHEDLAEARVVFSSGCVATFRVSRLALTATRAMQVFSVGGYARIDFASSQVQLVRPKSCVVDRDVDLDGLSSQKRMAAKDSIYGELLDVEVISAPGRNAILDEHNDFLLSIQTGSLPSVTGEDGERAVTLASQIIEAIADHQWDGVTSKPWRVGAHALVRPKILQLPSVAAQNEAAQRKAS